MPLCCITTTNLAKVHTEAEGAKEQIKGLLLLNKVMTSFCFLLFAPYGGVIALMECHKTLGDKHITNLFGT